MREAPEHFSFCPRCGRPASSPGARPFRCAACGFLYYFNAAVSAAVLIVAPDGQGLFIRRARDPGRDGLAFVGGFLDPGESAEDGLRREVREEVGLELSSLDYLCSHPNEYPYEQVVYPVLDLFFVGRAVDAASARPLEDVAHIVWRDPMTVDPAEMAFPSMTAALRHYQARR
ncbi:MAG TPA: NUDIX domain-containing protein [Vicinamibacterales bacterium]